MVESDINLGLSYSSSTGLAVQAQRDTVAWLECAVIGLNLCPFAKAVHVKGQIHYAVCTDTDPQQLLAQLVAELNDLNAQAASARDTTILIATSCLQDFIAYNDFLKKIPKILRKLGFEGVFQIASFHPQYQFTGVPEDDISNFTNRSPYPMLHLLREASIDRAIAAFPDAAAIYENNIRTLTALGHDGWCALDIQAKP